MSTTIVNLTLEEAIEKHPTWIGESGLLGGLNTANNSSISIFYRYLYDLKIQNGINIPLTEDVINTNNFIAYLEAKKESNTPGNFDQMITKAKDMISKGEMNNSLLIGFCKLFDNLAKFYPIYENLDTASYYYEKMLKDSYTNLVAKTGNSKYSDILAQYDKSKQPNTAQEKAQTQVPKTTQKSFSVDAEIKKEPAKTKDSPFLSGGSYSPTNEPTNKDNAPKDISSNDEQSPQSTTTSYKKVPTETKRTSQEDPQRTETERKLNLAPKAQRVIVQMPNGTRKRVKVQSKAQKNTNIRTETSEEKNEQKNPKQNSQESPLTTPQTRNQNSTSTSGTLNPVTSAGMKYFKRTALATLGMTGILGISYTGEAATFTKQTLVEIILKFIS